MTCAIHSFDLTGRCFACGHVDEAIRADQAAADARHAAWAAANPPPPDHCDAEIARLRALRDRYFAAAVATADAIDGGSLGPVHSGGESDAEFQAECVRFAEGLPARAAKVRAELASIDGALRDCYALARAKLARESRPGGWADIVRFCERAGIKASPLRSAEARDAAKADVPTPPPEIEAAITAAAWSIAELDRRADVMAQPEIGAIRTAITSALAAAREAGRRDVLEGAAGIDAALDSLSTEFCISSYALDPLLAAIAADKAALDDTWRAHDLERDAEVAQAQAATHEACAALQAICAALHVAPSTGSTYCAEAVAMVVERVAADKARAVEAASAGRHLCDLAGCDAPVTHIEKAAVVVNRDGATGRQDIWTCEEHADVGAVMLRPVLSAQEAAEICDAYAKARDAAQRAAERVTEARGHKYDADHDPDPPKFTRYDYAGDVTRAESDLAAKNAEMRAAADVILAALTGAGGGR